MFRFGRHPAGNALVPTCRWFLPLPSPVELNEGEGDKENNLEQAMNDAEVEQMGNILDGTNFHVS